MSVAAAPAERYADDFEDPEDATAADDDDNDCGYDELECFGTIGDLLALDDGAHEDALAETRYILNAVEAQLRAADWDAADVRRSAMKVSAIVDASNQRSQQQQQHDETIVGASPTRRAQLDGSQTTMSLKGSAASPPSAARSPGARLRAAARKVQLSGAAAGQLTADAIDLTTHNASRFVRYLYIHRDEPLVVARLLPHLAVFVNEHPEAAREVASPFADRVSSDSDAASPSCGLDVLGMFLERGVTAADGHVGNAAVAACAILTLVAKVAPIDQALSSSVTPVALRVLCDLQQQHEQMDATANSSLLRCVASLLRVVSLNNPHAFALADILRFSGRAKAILEASAGGAAARTEQQQHQHQQRRQAKLFFAHAVFRILLQLSDAVLLALETRQGSALEGVGPLVDLVAAALRFALLQPEAAVTEVAPPSPTDTLLAPLSPSKLQQPNDVDGQQQEHQQVPFGATLAAAAVVTTGHFLPDALQLLDHVLVEAPDVRAAFFRDASTAPIASRLIAALTSTVARRQCRDATLALHCNSILHGLAPLPPSSSAEGAAAATALLTTTATGRGWASAATVEPLTSSGVLTASGSSTLRSRTAAAEASAAFAAVVVNAILLTEQVDTAAVQSLALCISSSQSEEIVRTGLVFAYFAISGLAKWVAAQQFECVEDLAKTTERVELLLSAIAQLLQSRAVDNHVSAQLTVSILNVCGVIAEVAAVVVTTPRVRFAAADVAVALLRLCLTDASISCELLVGIIRCLQKLLPPPPLPSPPINAPCSRCASRVKERGNTLGQLALETCGVVLQRGGSLKSAVATLEEIARSCSGCAGALAIDRVTQLLHPAVANNDEDVTVAIVKVVQCVVQSSDCSGLTDTALDHFLGLVHPQTTPRVLEVLFTALKVVAKSSDAPSRPQRRRMRDSLLSAVPWMVSLRDFAAALDELMVVVTATLGNADAKSPDEAVQPATATLLLAVLHTGRHNVSAKAGAAIAFVAVASLIATPTTNKWNGPQLNFIASMDADHYMRDLVSSEEADSVLNQAQRQLVIDALNHAQRPASLTSAISNTDSINAVDASVATDLEIHHFGGAQATKDDDVAINQEPHARLRDALEAEDRLERAQRDLIHVRNQLNRTQEKLAAREQLLLSTTTTAGGLRSTTIIGPNGNTNGSSELEALEQEIAEASRVIWAKQCRIRELIVEVGTATRSAEDAHRNEEAVRTLRRENDDLRKLLAAATAPILGSDSASSEVKQQPGHHLSPAAAPRSASSRPRPKSAAATRAIRAAAAAAAGTSADGNPSSNDAECGIRDGDAAKLAFRLNTLTHRVNDLQRRLTRAEEERTLAQVEATEARLDARRVALMHRNEHEGLEWAARRIERLEKQRAAAQRAVAELREAARETTAAREQERHTITAEFNAERGKLRTELQGARDELHVAMQQIATLQEELRRKTLINSQLITQVHMLRKRGASSKYVKSESQHGGGDNSSAAPTAHALSNIQGAHEANPASASMAKHRHLLHRRLRHCDPHPIATRASGPNCAVVNPSAASTDLERRSHITVGADDSHEHRQTSPFRVAPATPTDTRLGKYDAMLDPHLKGFFTAGNVRRQRRTKNSPEGGI